ncbi:sigma-54 dependent transcriptional regulator [uncultured Desulfobulbus sp.]|uniref:sigma-54-dependent transcriptional regulator n=1 Tax=uncultured Desulfobulbus sp. TaxID=239745 RepID=UPI0029C9AE78|nr:sigma-54 dependent transcriptional regulator [uncultured Desulfobulbus sp.]
MQSKLRVLIIDDEENMRHMLSSVLGRLGYAVQSADNGRSGLDLLKKEAFDVVLCDIRMPEMDGMEFLRQAASEGMTVTIIMMSAFGSLDTAMAALRLGAYDYISKPFKADEIELTLRKAEEREGLRRDNCKLRHQLASMEGDFTFGKMVARSKSMQEVFALAAKVAPHSTTVLITGESGTGKELVAQGIHQLSGRDKGRFVAVNCGGLPENLIESELFGYKKGAFTGADKDKQGLFLEADGGTLFLDEIGELPLPLQVKLLRVLQENEIQPIGAAKPHKINVRIITATARDLPQEISMGLFRQDLFYRLNVVHVSLPPLRERTGDISLLSEFFLKRYVRRLDSPVTGIAPATMSLLLNHSWPGNVRELENVIERAVVLAEKRVILPENLPSMFGTRQGGRRLDDFFGGFSIKQAQKIVESSLIRRALEATGGNKSKASELLEISYPSLLSKIKEYGIGDVC